MSQKAKYNSLGGNIVHYRHNQEISGSLVLNRQLLRDRMCQHRQTNFSQVDLKGHYGCVNAIEFSSGRGDLIASGGDDRRVLVWNAEKAVANRGYSSVMIGQHNSNIFCLCFDANNRKIFSGGNDEQVIVHDVETRKLLDVYLHDDVVYGLSTDPNNDHVFASTCDDGSALIYDTRLPNTDAFTLAKYDSPMHAIMYNPVDPRLLVTANAKEGIALWDIRKPLLPLMRYGSTVQQSCMSLRINQTGDRIIAIRRRLPLVLYDIKHRLPLCEFDHQSYYNSCTMKSCTFAGENDEYVLSGSDDFNLYMWKIPTDLSSRCFVNDAHVVLKGHRSIVNQVRSNPSNNLIISSGVEKVIKAWSPFQIHNVELLPEERTLYTHEEYINLILNSGQGMSHDYSQRSVEEEPRMMAFFDSLVQREIEGWSSDEELSSNDEELYRRIIQVSQSDSESTNSGAESERMSPFTRGFVTVMASRSLSANTPEGRLLDPRVNNCDIDPFAVESENEASGEQATASSADYQLAQSLESGNKLDNTSVLNGESPGDIEHVNSSPASVNQTVSQSTTSVEDSAAAVFTDVTLGEPHSIAVAPVVTVGHMVSRIAEFGASTAEGASETGRSWNHSLGPRFDLQAVSSQTHFAPVGACRYMSQLIAKKCSVKNRGTKVKRKVRVIDSSESSSEDEEFSSSAVRAKVLKQTRRNTTQTTDSKSAAGYNCIKNLRSLPVYSSEDELNGVGAKHDCKNGTAASSCTGEYSGLLDIDDDSRNDCSVEINAVQKCEQCASHRENKICDETQRNNEFGELNCEKDAQNTNCANKNSVNCTKCELHPRPSTSATTLNDCDRTGDENRDDENHDDRDEESVNTSDGNSQPMWTEFKRFKNRMKKAQRYYRQQSQQGRRRSSDDDD